jgi:aminopeptidase N
MSCLSRECNSSCAYVWILISPRVKPVHYDISLSDLEFGGDWKYKGLVKIDTKVTKATKEIVLNTKELEIQSAKIWTAEAKSRVPLTGLRGIWIALTVCSRAKLRSCQCQLRQEEREGNH